MEALRDLAVKNEFGVFLIILLVVLLPSVYIRNIPHEITSLFTGVSGRSLLFIFVSLVTEAYGTATGILSVIMGALLVASGSEETEGFSSDMRIVPNKQKWFIEHVLGENPLIIEDDTVDTIAVQSASNEAYGSHSSSIHHE